jgi:hypothetical protein
VLGQRENGAEAVLPKAEVVLIATPKAIRVGEWPELEVLLESLEKRHPSKTTVGIRFSSEAELP